MIFNIPETIIQKEEEYSLHLDASDGGLTKEMLVKRQNWSGEILEFSLNQPTWVINKQNEESALKFISNPVFIGGCPRSGTTLLSNLIDGNSEVCSLPSETLFFEFISNKIKNKSEADQFSIVANDWLQRLASPTNWGSYFFFGRTTKSKSPYIDFIIYLRAWWSWVDTHLNLQYTKPLVAVTLAYATIQGNGQISDKTRYWIEKSPGNENYYDLFKTDFKNSKFVFLLRNPVNVVSSHDFIFQNISHRKKTYFYLRNKKRYECLSVLQNKPEVFIVRYEKLIQDRAAQVKKVLRFIGVSFNEINLKQTINGLGTARNSSFSVRKKSQMQLSEEERFRIYFMAKAVSEYYPEEFPISGYKSKYLMAVLKFHIEHIYNLLVSRFLKVLRKIPFRFRQSFY